MKYLILMLFIPIFGFSQYGNVEFSSGGFSFIPAFTDPNPNINFNAGTGNKKLISAYMVGSIRTNRLSLRSLFFVTQIKLLDKKSKKLKLSGGIVFPLIQIDEDYTVNTYFSQRIAANYLLSKKIVLNTTFIHGKGINNNLEINFFSLSKILNQKKISFITQLYYLDLNSTYGIAETINYRLSSRFDLRGFVNQTLSSNEFIWTLGLRYNL